MSLYKIDEAILNCVDEETGEILDQETFEKLNMERNAKIENLALWVKNLKAEVLAYKAEKASFEERAKTAENKAKNIEKYLTNLLQGSKFTTNKVSISFRKSSVVDIDDNVVISTLPKELIRTKVTVEADKKAIKEYLNDGNELRGIRIKENNNIQIK